MKYRILSPKAIMTKLRNIFIRPKTVPEKSSVIQDKKKLDEKTAPDELTFPIHFGKPNPTFSSLEKPIVEKSTDSTIFPDKECHLPLQEGNSSIKGEPKPDVLLVKTLTCKRTKNSRAKTQKTPFKFIPSFFLSKLASRSQTRKYVSRCSSLISSYTKECKGRFLRIDSFRRRSKLSRSFIHNNVRDLFKKRLVWGRPVFPPSPETSLLTERKLLSVFRAKGARLDNKQDWWKKFQLPNMKDKARPISHTKENNLELIKNLVPNAPELAAASNGSTKLLSHVIEKKKHIEALSMFASEFITIENMDRKIQEALENPTTFNLSVEEMLREQYKISQIYSFVSERVDEKIGFSQEKLKESIEGREEKKKNDFLGSYEFAFNSLRSGKL